MAIDKNARVEFETTRCEGGEKAETIDRSGEPLPTRNKQAEARTDHKTLADRIREVLP